MIIPKKMQEIIRKYNPILKTYTYNAECDLVLIEMYNEGGRPFVEKFLELLDKAEFKADTPIFTIVNGKLYKRVD